MTVKFSGRATTISRWAGGVLLAASLLPWAAVASATTGSGDVEINTNQVPTTAATFKNHDCTSGTFDQAQLAAGKDGYHFVLTGNGYAMTALRAYFDSGTISTTSFVHDGTQAYVYVAHGATLQDAWADVTPTLAADANIQLVLSGTCVGSDGGTTTPATPCPTTTVTKTVTATVPGPTTTVDRTVTATVTSPGPTQTVTTTEDVPGPTVTKTVTATATKTVTATQTVTATETATVTATKTVTEEVPGPTQTVTTTVPGETVTTTAPGATVTTTAPGATVTTTAPGSTATVTQTVTASDDTSVLPTKIGHSTTPAGGGGTSPGTAVLGEKVGLPQTGPGLPVGKALALSLVLMIAGVSLLALPGHIGLEVNRKH